MIQRKKDKVLTNARDAAVFEFLWRWKLATTRALAEKFFGSAKTDTAYNRLLRLRNVGYLKLRSLDPEGRKFVWTLSQKGFELLTNRLPELNDEGFRSENLEHDHLVTAMHLGEWLVATPENVEIFTEQELRRFHLEHYPSWVPRTDYHRPDGYWRVPYKNRMITVALEVELTPKVDKRYFLVAEFYQKNSDISRVVWLVRSHGIAKAIQEKFRSAVKSEALIHNFVVRADFESLGWQAPVFLGHEQGRTLAFALGIRETAPMQCRMQYPSGRMVTALLDTRKRPGNSTFSTKTAPARFVDRMAYRPSEYPIQVTSHQATVNVHITPTITPTHQETTTDETRKVS